MSPNTVVSRRPLSGVFARLFAGMPGLSAGLAAVLLRAPAAVLLAGVPWSRWRYGVRA